MGLDSFITLSERLQSLTNRLRVVVNPTRSFRTFQDPTGHDVLIAFKENCEVILMNLPQMKDQFRPTIKLGRDVILSPQTSQPGPHFLESHQSESVACLSPLQHSS